MKNILYATDCSGHDADTLQYAYALSGILKADLTVLHIYSIPPIGVSTIRPKQYLSKHAFDEQLDVLKHYCASHLKDIGSGTIIKYEVMEDDSVSDGIMSKVASLSPDLLIVGMKDEHTARGSFTGSIAKALIMKVATPLLVVPSTMTFQKIEILVYATDFAEEDVLAISKLVKIAEPFGAFIKIVHIPKDGEDGVKDQMDRLKEMVYQKTNYRNFTFEVVNSETAYEGLRSYIKTTDADMIALLEREDVGILKKLFHRDLVKKMESKIDIPMMSLNVLGL